MKKIILCLSFLSQVVFAESQKIDIEVNQKGFEPKQINVKPGSDVTLNIVRKTEMTCATKIQIPSLQVSQDLPLNRPVTIALGKLKKGEIRFGCQEQMMESGVISVK